MSLCKLCSQRDADKKNTHYLTDSIIRTCLNKDGSNIREQGLYFDMSTSNPFIKFNFQRLDQETLQSIFEREPTEEELENARMIPFSVDFVFCNECEKKFTEIENKFTKEILPKFRQNDLNNLEVLVFEERKIIRDFFYIQIYRSAECETAFNLSDDFRDKLKNIILNDIDDNSIPLSITYLQTLGGPEYYTQNYVGFTSDKTPKIIIMNDFVIQVFEKTDEISFLDFYGLNKEASYREFVNIEESHFKINILTDEERKEFINALMLDVKVRPTIEYFKKCFELMWVKLFNFYPTESEKALFVYNLVTTNPNDLLKFTEEQVIDFTKEYLNKLILSRR